MGAIELLLSVGFWLTVTGIYTTLKTAQKVWPKFFQKPLVQRALPLAPVLLGGLAMALIPGLSEFSSIGARILHGLVAGTVASHFKKIGAQTILGNGIIKALPGTEIPAAEEEKKDEQNPPEN